MKKFLLAGMTAAALLALSQQPASAWFNLYAGGAASISWGPPHCSYFANKGGGGAAVAPAYGAPAYPAFGDGLAGYGDGFAGYGAPAYGAPAGYGDGLSGYGGTPAAPYEPSKPWTAPSPTPSPMQSPPSAPKGGGSGTQPETMGLLNGYQPAGYFDGYQPTNWDGYQAGSQPINWNSYQGGYQPADAAGYYQGGYQPIGNPASYFQGGYQGVNPYDYSGYGAYQAPSWYGR
jgi:hypothetical protein